MAEDKKWFGRGIYGSKDVPIRILDGFIIGAICFVVILVFWFATHGGYNVTFDTEGGSEIAAQRLKHGELAKEPETPLKPGYTFCGWITSEDESLAKEWNFSEDRVENDQTLYAVWTPAEVTVKFELDGGKADGETFIPDKTVTYGEAYGELPVPEKEGFLFDGWVYSGAVIKADTTVTMTGEHVLTARWIPAE